MDTLYLKACANFFRRRFPDCSTCRGGFEGRQTMLAHLTASHFEREAISAFGKGLSCSLCGKRLPQHGSLFKHYYMLSHMARHFGVIAPEEIKPLFEVTTEAVAGGAHSEAEKPSASKTVSVSEGLFEEVDVSEDDDIEDVGMESGSVTSSDAKVKAKPGCKSTNPDRGKCKSTMKHKSQKVSRSDSAKTKFKSALKHKPRKVSIGEGTEASFQTCQEHFRNKYPTCGTCKRGHDCIANMKRHLVLQHLGEEAINLFGSGNTCAICKKFSTDNSYSKNRTTAIKLHMKAHLALLLTDDREKELLKFISKSYLNSKPSLTWGDCQEYFKNKFPLCDTCKIGHESYDQLRYHLIEKHYLKQAIEIFGTNTTCPICQSFSIDPLGGSPIERIKKHMKCHLEDFVPDEEARTHLRNLKLFKKAKKIPSSTELSVQKPVKKSASIQDCENYFRDKYPSCKACQKGHSTFTSMKRHLTKFHYQSRAMSLFGTGSTCKICGNYSTKRSKTWSRSDQIKSHMAAHLEHFIVEDEANSLLLKANGLAKC